MLKGTNSIVNASQINGTLPVANGGTGASSFTSGRLLKGNGTGAVSASVVYEDGTNVGIGTTNYYGTLSVRGGCGFNADTDASIPGSGNFKFQCTPGATAFTTYDYLNYTAAEFIRNNGNPTNVVGSITCTDTGTLYNITSDSRVKENIEDATEDAGSVIDNIRIRKFDWKEGGAHSRFGVIAQELIVVAPEAVSGDPDGDKTMGVDYSKLVPVLIKEIQNLRLRLARLEIISNKTIISG